MTRFGLLALVAVLVLIVAACAEDDVAEDATPDNAADDEEVADEQEADEEVADEESSEGVDVALAESDLGEILVDGEGMTLYLFEVDEPNESNCYDDCEVNWPPLVTDSEPTAGGGVDEGLLSTTERDDGSMQVTYDGHPLYYWIGDEEPGDVAGQAVEDVWWVLGADGEAIHSAPDDEDDEDDEEDAGGY